jgi:V-type H+-transporting ATPase subunit a
MPPTYFKLNEFKSVFQLIVDTYGVPRYKEVNPGLFTIITFPFLFGVMFGDIGHGGLLFIFGLYLLFFKDSILADKTSSLKAVVPARYLVTLMGFFALYAGLIYNDFLSLNLNLFGSCYVIVPNKINALRKNDCVYPFGKTSKITNILNE